eukprot:403339999
MESSTQINTVVDQDSEKIIHRDIEGLKQQIKEQCSNLNDEHIQDIVETFNTFDFDGEGFVQEIEVVATMLMSMNCDVTKQMILDLHQDLFNAKFEEDTEITIVQFARMVDHFVQEADPVDGVIATIQESYDEESTGKCKFSDIIKFMEEYNYLEADPESCMKILTEFKDSNDNIEYAIAMKKLIQ